MTTPTNLQQLQEWMFKHDKSKSSMYNKYLDRLPECTDDEPILSCQEFWDRILEEIDYPDKKPFNTSFLSEIITQHYIHELRSFVFEYNDCDDRLY